MTSPDSRDPDRPALLPAGRRWGRGAGSVAPYLRDAWSGRPLNPVFTPGQVAAVVWPPAPQRPSPPPPV